MLLYGVRIRLSASKGFCSSMAVYHSAMSFYNKDVARRNVTTGSKFIACIMVVFYCDNACYIALLPVTIRPSQFSRGDPIVSHPSNKSIPQIMLLKKVSIKS